MRAPLLLVSIALAMTLPGCMSVRISPIEMDSPRPVDGWPGLCAEGTPGLTTASSLAPVAAASDTGTESAKADPAATLHLDPGARCLFPVRADRRLTLTPLRTLHDETYRIVVPRNQVWYDRGRRNVAPQGEPGSSLMNLTKSWKRHRDMAWFALVAANTVPGGGESTFIDVSGGDDLKIGVSGQLAFYPNDALAPVASDFFYSNNSGQIWVQIEHCMGTCASTPAGRN